MQATISSLAELYDIPESLRLLTERREAWATASGGGGYDHHGRMPLRGLRRPTIEPDPGKAGRSALFVARQFAQLLDASPAVVEAWDPLPGAFGYDLASLLPAFWPPEWLDAEYRERTRASRIGLNIGMPGHFVPDLAIGLSEGWGGLERRIDEARERPVDARGAEYLEALAVVVRASRLFIRRHAETARELSLQCAGREAAALRALADQIEAVEGAPPATTWQALVWISLFVTLNRLYNFQNTIGRLDQILGPLYEADRAADRLSDDEARFLLAALLVHDTHFICIGGTDASGRDASNRVSRLVLEAWREVRGPANIGLRWHDGCPDDLLDLAERCLLETGQGTPTLLNDAPVVSGLVGQGIPLPLARGWSYGGCHWWGVPGRSYGLSDGTKVNLLAILQDALDRMMEEGPRSMERLWRELERGIRDAFAAAREGYRIQMSGPGRTFPELLQSLFCHGPIERGRDALDGGVDHYVFLADGVGLANVADALTALTVLVEQKALLRWDEVRQALLDGFEGHARVRQMLLNAPKYGNDDPAADEAAARVRDIFVSASRAAAAPGERFSIMAGFYSWNVHAWLADMPASPDGRARGTAVAHGANPMAGQARRGLSALARSVAAIQPGTGASAPLHLEIEARAARGESGRAAFDALVRGYFSMGGVQIIANFVSRKTLEDAIAHPEKHRDLAVRVTGYSAYFVNLDKSLYPEILSRFD